MVGNNWVETDGLEVFQKVLDNICYKSMKRIFPENWFKIYCFVDA